MKWSQCCEVQKATRKKLQCTAQAFGIERRRPSVLYPITSCYCHTTQAAVAAPATMMEHPSPPEKECLLTISSSPGPQENKPISCHCDRIKMEPSYFSNTMQAKGRRERDSETERHPAPSPYPANELWTSFFLTQRL